MSFMAFLTKQRMKLAQRLLGDLTLSVSEIAAMAGFNDANYFSRRFKKVTGVTPSEWRAKL